jgi:hypothetical protein
MMPSCASGEYVMRCGNSCCGSSMSRPMPSWRPLLARRRVCSSESSSAGGQVRVGRQERGEVGARLDATKCQLAGSVAGAQHAVRAEQSKEKKMSVVGEPRSR